MPSPSGYQGYQGAPPKKGKRTSLLAVAVLVVIAVVLVYAVVVVTPLGSGEQTNAQHLTAPGTPCDSPALPTAITGIEQSPAFVALSGGACYNYMPDQASSTGTNQTLVFDLYNGTVIYPCGTAPDELVASEIDVVADSSYAVQSLKLYTDTASLNGGYDCPNPPAVGVQSVEYIEVTIPAIPEVNVTLFALQGGQPVVSLTAVLTLGSSSYTASYGKVTQSDPLLPGAAASSLVVVGTGAINNSEIFPMTISGTFLGGQTFSYHVQVVVTSTYAGSG